MWIIFSGNRRSEGFVWFRGLSLASVAVAQLALYCHGDLSGCSYTGRVFRFFVEAFCGAWAGCAAEETIGATAKPNWFLWVKQKLVVSYYTLRWQGKRICCTDTGKKSMASTAKDYFCTHTILAYLRGLLYGFPDTAVGADSHWAVVLYVC